MEALHTPVMTEEVLQHLAPDEHNALLIDATLGEGGHSELFLKAFPHLRIVGIDCDSDIQERARERLAPFGGRMRFYASWFDDFFGRYPLIERPTRILFDFGLSMAHLRLPGRGFSFATDEPLDMRLNRHAPKRTITTAADAVNRLSERQLGEILSNLGEERYAGSIARRIVAGRRQRPIQTTRQLAEIIRAAVPPKYRYGSIHPATRSFQALRILINDELAHIERALPAALACLKPNGRIGCIAFHSLEDRIVKRFMRAGERPADEGHSPTLSLPVRRAIRPTVEEIGRNPAARSARLRIAVKIARRVA